MAKKKPLTRMKRLIEAAKTDARLADVLKVKSAVKLSLYIKALDQGT